MLFDCFSGLWVYWAGEIRKWCWSVESVFGDKVDSFISLYFQIFRGSLGTTGSYFYCASLWVYNKSIGEAKWALEAAKYLNASFPLLINLILMGNSRYPALPQGGTILQPLGKPGARMRSAGSPAGHTLADKEWGKELFDWRRVHTKWPSHIMR